jgi:hypothetical protein
LERVRVLMPRYNGAWRDGEGDVESKIVVKKGIKWDTSKWLFDVANRFARGLRMGSKLTEVEFWRAVARRWRMSGSLVVANDTSLSNVDMQVGVSRRSAPCRTVERVCRISNISVQELSSLK